MTNVYSSQTITIANGQIEIKFDVMWHGKVVISMTLLKTGETFPITDDEAMRFISAYWDAEGECDYVNS